MSPLFRSAAIITLLTLARLPAVAAADEAGECPESIALDLDDDALDGYLVESTEAIAFMIVGTNLVLIGRSVTGHYQTSDGQTVQIDCGIHGFAN